MVSSCTLSILLSSSLLINLFCLSSYLLRPPQLGWTIKAALEAEAVSRVPCSGHGEAFLDGILVDGVPSCECHTCYRGPDCSELNLDCVVEADSGDPLFLEGYWKQHAASSAVVISGWHRMSYGSKIETFMSVELERHIRLLHARVGNAETDGRFIVFGVGATQLLNALVHALSPENATTPAIVVGNVPFYNVYKSQTEFFDSKKYKWSGASSDWTNRSDTSNLSFVEFVTSPNNPDGQLKKPVLSGSSVIYDHVYYWPHFTPIPSKVDGDVMLFSMSKLSGHAGSRLGWAILKEKEIYEKVLIYIIYNTLGVSHSTQLRMLKMIKAILEHDKGGEDDILAYGYEKMSKRWRRLSDVVASTKRFSLQSISPQYCTYFNKIRDPSPAYGWLKCEMEEDEDCYEVLRNAGISTRTGSRFGASTRYTRLSLLRGDDDFELLINKLEALVSSEDVKVI